MCYSSGAMSATIEIGGPAAGQRSETAARAVRVLAAVMEGRREQLVHDAWTLRSLFSGTVGPFRRAGFAPQVAVRALAAEMDRLGSLHGDPIDEAFWLLAEQGARLNASVVDARAVSSLFSARGVLRPSQRQAALRLLEARTRCLAHPEGSHASNLLLVAVLAGGVAAAASGEALRRAADARFPGGLPFHPADEVSELLLAPEVRQRLDERALRLDMSRASSIR